MEETCKNQVDLDQQIHLVIYYTIFLFTNKSILTKIEQLNESHFNMAAD